MLPGHLEIHQHLQELNGAGRKHITVSIPNPWVCQQATKVKKSQRWHQKQLLEGQEVLQLCFADDLEQKSLGFEILPCFFPPRTAAWQVHVIAVRTWINKKYFFSVHQLLNTKGRFSLKDKSSGPSTEHSGSVLKLKTSHYTKWLYEQNSVWKHLKYIRFLVKMKAWERKKKSSNLF